MQKRNFLLEDPAREGPDNAHTRGRIDDALLELMAEGERINHDLVAERAGVSRRTVYRYYPDRDALLKALWSRLSPGLFTDKMPWSVPVMLERQVELFEWFDDNAAAMTVAMASAQGRAMRNAMKEERVKSYRHALADETAHLDEPAKTQAIALIQFLNSGFAWREMRDQWDLSGPEIAEACNWAIRTLVAALERGDGPGRRPTD
jgi:AcrR family transcriptional regulator